MGRSGYRPLPQTHTEPPAERVQQELDEALGTAPVVCNEDRKPLPHTCAVLHAVPCLSSVVAMGAVRHCVTSTVCGYPVSKTFYLIVNSKLPFTGQKLAQRAQKVPSRQMTLQSGEVEGAVGAALFAHWIGYALNLFHELRSGTIILPHLASVLYDPECWENRRQFNPGHFLDQNGNSVAIEAFLPFSAGHCVCPGDQLAPVELFLMFATRLGTFRFQLPEGSQGSSCSPSVGALCSPSRRRSVRCPA
ncbi:Cytochrome P450 2K1 [Plecturocebus cupreus]